MNTSGIPGVLIAIVGPAAVIGFADYMLDGSGKKALAIGAIAAVAITAGSYIYVATSGQTDAST